MIALDSLLVSKPDYREGRPCLRGTGITVHNVAGYYRLGHTAEEMASNNPDLDLSLFHAAIAYYLANKAQIDAEIDADIEWETEVATKFPNGIGPGKTSGQ